MIPMTFTYTGIRVRDLDRSIEFYTRVLGMKLQSRTRIRETQGAVALLKSPRGRQRLELNWYEPESPFATPYRKGEQLDHLAFRTRNLTAKIREIRKLRIPVVAGPMGPHRSAWAYIRDPDGIWIEIIGPLAPRKRPRAAIFP
ncbi:MAG TPA: VOC family protein [Thermoplasmata archaeon]|nr:VOC family protein [Thermoplasmata archaeon]